MNIHKRIFEQTQRKDKSKLDLRLPTKQEIEACYLETKAALDKILDSKLGVNQEKKEIYVKYTPSANTLNRQNGSSGKQRLIQIVEAEVDPLLPPKFKNNQKTPALKDNLLANTSIVENGTQDKDKSKLMTVEEQRAWYIPPAISNWKNPKGFAISVEQRQAAFNGGKVKNEAEAVNNNFIKLAESLSKADSRAREELKARRNLKLKALEKQKMENEEKLKRLAQEKHGRRNYQEDGSRISKSDRDRIGDRKRRILEFEKKLKSGRNLQRNGDDDDDNKSGVGAGVEQESQYGIVDARLFTESKLKNSFKRSDDIYETPLFNVHEGLQSIYTGNVNKGDGEDRTYKVLGGDGKVEEREGAVKFVKEKEKEKEKEKGKEQEQ